MGNNTFTTTGNFNWTVPPNVYTVKVELWGGGGGGAGGNATVGSAAGGGGAFAQRNAYSVTPGWVHLVTVGNGGNGGAANANGANGGTTIFRSAINNTGNSNNNAAYAIGGTRGTRNSASNAGGGALTSSNGDVRFSGGNGAGRSNNNGGSGGGAAGNNANGSAGSNGVNAVGGAGGNANGGNGGNAYLGGNGENGYFPGGGGAGGSNGNRVGGRGGVGQIIISWSDPTIPTVTTDSYSDVTLNTANASGNVTSLGDQPQNVTTRGFVYDTQTRSDPGNNTPDNSTYNNFVSENGSWGVGTFTLALNNLANNTTYYFRAFGYHNVGYDYGNELTFTTLKLIADNATQNTTFNDSSIATVDSNRTSSQNFTLGDTSDAEKISGAIIALFSSANVANNNTTTQLTPPAGKNNTNFTTGKMVDDTNPISVITLNNTYTEVEWSLAISSSAANNTIIQFRITDNGTAFNNYSVTPVITLGTSNNNGNTYSDNCVEGIGFGTATSKNALLNAALLESINLTLPSGKNATFTPTATQNATFTSSSDRINTTIASLQQNATFSSTANKVAQLVSLLTQSMSLSTAADRAKLTNALLSSAFTSSDVATKIATLTSLLQSAVSIQDSSAKIASLGASLASSLNLGSTAGFGSTIQGILEDAATFLSSTTRIASFSSIASSVVSINASSNVVWMTNSGLQQSLSLTTAAARRADATAAALQSFTLHDTLAYSLLFAALASQAFTLSSTSDADISSIMLAFCTEVLNFQSTDLAGLQAVASLIQSFTTSASVTATTTFVKTASQAFTLTSSSDRAKTLAAALSTLFTATSTATPRRDLTTSAQATINLSTNIANLANLINRAVEAFTIGGTTDWIGSGIATLVETLGIASTVQVERFIAGVSLASVAFTDALLPKVLFDVVIAEHITLTDVLSILRIVATVCQDVFNIRDISFWLSATGAVSITFQLAKGSVTFALTKPSITAGLTKPTIDFE